jgi:hypothetical protein
LPWPQPDSPPRERELSDPKMSKLDPSKAKEAKEEFDKGAKE